MFAMLLAGMLTSLSYFFFFDHAPTTEIYTLSLHDALPISKYSSVQGPQGPNGPIDQKFSSSPTEMSPRRTIRLSGSADTRFQMRIDSSSSLYTETCNLEGSTWYSLVTRFQANAIASSL